MNKEEINVNIMSSEELEDFEYLIQNYSKSKLAYKIIKIEEESRSYYNANLELRQENKQLKEIIDKAIEYMNEIKYDKTDEYIPISQYKEYKILLEILKGDSNGL